MAAIWTPDRCRRRVHQRHGGVRSPPAVRRHQAIRLRPRTRHSRHPRVRQHQDDLDRAGKAELTPCIPVKHARHNFPPIKGGRYSIRASRFLTDDRCHLLPRAGRTPRPFRALAISARLSAPAFRIAWTKGVTFVANSSATCACARRPIEPAIQRFVELPRFAPLALFACSAAVVRSDISRRSFSAKAAYRCSMNGSASRLSRHLNSGHSAIRLRCPLCADFVL
jgi:hypothetical protein